MMSLNTPKTLIIITFLILTVIFPPATSIELKCQFRISAWWQGPAFYECEDTESSIETLSDATVTGVNGRHMSGKKNDDVKSFYAYRKTMRIFPKGLENTFKNLEIIAIVSEKLQQIRQFELKPFFKLRVLYLDSNEIETLDRDLFKFNLIIEAINFSNNRIRYVDVSVFKHLVSLRSLWFENNVCHSTKANESPAAVVKVIDEIRERCFVDNILTNLQYFQETELASMKMEISALRQENGLLRSKIEGLKIENARQGAEATNVGGDLKKCEGEKREIRAELTVCNDELKNLTRTVLLRTAEDSRQHCSGDNIEKGLGINTENITGPNINRP